MANASHDPTPVVVNGVEIDRNSIDPIAVPEDIVPGGPRVRIPASPKTPDNMPIAPTYSQPHFQSSPQPSLHPSPLPQPSPSPSPLPTAIYQMRSLPRYVNTEKMVQSHIEVPDFDQMTPQQLLKTRFDYRNKFLALRSAYPDLFREGEYSYGLDAMKADMSMVYIEYVSFMDMLDIHTTASNYRSCMIIGWFAIEGILTWIGIDTKGFTQHQIKSLNRYEAHFLALGEKSQMEGGSLLSMSDWSPEASILFMTLISSVAFVAVKVLAPKFHIPPQLAEGMLEELTGYLSGSGASNPMSGQVPGQGMIDSFANIILNNPDMGTAMGNVAKTGQQILQGHQLPNPSSQLPSQSVPHPSQPRTRFIPQYDED